MRSFCISLPEQPAKRERATAHFRFHGVAPEFFTGINAPVAGLTTSHTYERDHPGTGFRMGSAPTGCWLSHYMLWGALALQPEEHFLVLEDDAKLCDEFAGKFRAAVANTPRDFDFLHVGHCCLKGHPQTHVTPDIVETKCVQCTHAYVVARKCLPFLLQTMRRVWAPIDIQLQLEAFPHLKTYAVVPRIVDQFNTEIPP